ncbi:GTPase IMAP family member 3-like [Colossoma macropomum]|uniref:GTPase IMAP family member 3-like n=1 Tax=Colossoma macropomum TaxID=42526 RepID=UPI00186568F9|nr:GTPase IMAP family member 3-like [Colossoma macropomum]
MASSNAPSRPQRRGSLTFIPPDMRIMLLGKNRQEIRRVRNFILRRDMFDAEAPPSSVEQHSEKARERVEGRDITLINTPQLFDIELSDLELSERVKECMTLCDPGPHVIMLVTQPGDFTEADRN